MVVGFPRGSGDLLVRGDAEPGSAWTMVPSFFWISATLPLQWPLILPARWPEGMEVAVVLDLDGDGRPSAGDPASALRPVSSSAPEGEEIQFHLDAAVPNPPLSGDELLQGLEADEPESEDP